MPASVIAALRERLESQHGRAAAFDRAMILLNDVVQVGAVPDRERTSTSDSPGAEAAALVARRVPVERDFARPPRQGGRQCLAEECLCRRNASIGSEQKVDGLAPLVDGAVEVVPLRRIGMYVSSTRQDECDLSGPSTPPFFELRHVPDHPPQDRGVRNLANPRSAIISTRSR